MTNPYNIQFDRLPRRAQVRIDGIKTLLQLAHEMEYELLKVDYKLGMIKIEWGAVALYWYTTTFTITVETPPKAGDKYPRQQHYKNCQFQKAKEIISNPLEFRKK